MCARERGRVERCACDCEVKRLGVREREIVEG
jgi:hypothetical protein